MPHLLLELSKTHTETEAKTLFNELEICGDGSGWILDFTTFVVMMLHKSEIPSVRHATQQWKS